MGRHRRSDAASAVGQQRRKRAAAAPVRTGLLGVSAAVALGTVAVTSGVLPTGDTFRLGSDDSRVQADGSSDVQAQGGASEAAERGETPASRGSDRATPSVPSPSESPAEPSAKPSKDADAENDEKNNRDKKGKEEQASKAPASTAPDQAAKKPDQPEKAKNPGQAQGQRRAESAKPAPAPAPAPAQATGAAAEAEAEVLSLVNQERAKAGCAPVRADARLATLARNFSQDMATRGFFDHTDPDGDTPWDRADQAGIDNMGGENIARGQADARAVMESWMNSPGHRANILNCDYTTLGVGAHFASGGPWWTQNFGF
ncbi:CAP domain-containing protein [Streptomyces apocyni]|uniref:CAP domain-containing protein n=1 Tax=Streptomyces apocyni TaxID=2654677 RepID=UPI0012E9C455|nr:CAP domain-containing protein [Streptomyces apocyni]